VAHLTYAWSNSTAAQSLNGVGAGTYTLTITDANSCSFTVSADVTQPAQLVAADSVVSIVCHGDSTGSIFTTNSGGTPGYTYMWSNGSSSANLTGVVANTYTLTITDANQCTVSLTATINQPSAITVTTGANNASSPSASDGSAWVTPAGGTPPYTVYWPASGASTDTITHLSADTYAVTITDSAGCTFATYAVVGATPTGIGSIGAALVKVFPNPANAQVIIQATSTDTKYIFSLYSMDGQLVSEVNVSGGKTAVNLQQLSAGLYTYHLKDITSGATQFGKLEVQH
jgi:Secretion system C-terminal sorting domain/SprB repeat